MTSTASTSNDGPIERHAITTQASATDFPTLITRFEEIVRLYPRRIAVRCDSVSVTYAELNRRAAEIAHSLAAAEHAQQSIVAIWLDRSIEMIASMLGVLKAGHVYLPLEATYPASRIEQTLEDSGAAVLISTHAFAATLSEVRPQLMTLSALDHAVDFASVVASPSDLAYVMYTSGSTGRPKGVLVTHANVLRLLDRTIEEFEFTRDDVWTMFHSFAFDFSVWEIWGALLTGAQLLMVPFETTRSPEDFHRLVSESGVSVLNQTPGAFAHFLQADAKSSLPLALRLVIFGGEALKFPMLRSWFDRHEESSTRFYNCYGITETTVHVTLREVVRRDAFEETESLIGRPISDLDIYLLGTDGMPVSDGAVGELCVGGPGVSNGYLNRPELTADRFVINAADPNAGRMYKSGDLARRREDGELVYMGRLDAQQKISGFRVEPGEVESAILDYPAVAGVCVLAKPDDAGKLELVAYFVQQPGAQLSLASLVAHLGKNLPPHMVPTRFLRVAEIPLTSNGKTDAKAIAQLSPLPLDESAIAREPASDLERGVLAMVRAVVQSDAVDIEDNFFFAGGQSLIATSLVQRIRKMYGVSFTLRDIFEADTIAEIAARIETLIIEDISKLSEDDVVRMANVTHA